MKITVFTSDQPRHLALIQSLSRIARVNAVQMKSKVKKTKYFSIVREAERKVFGGAELPELSKFPLSESDIIIVFGYYYILSPLLDTLIEKKAINIHMGISPQYRGTACNFWAMYDGKPEYVGGTIHLLSKKLDGGDILFHAYPPKIADPFLFTMAAIKSAHDKLIENIHNLKDFIPKPQNKELEIRYTKARDFTDEIAKEYLKAMEDKCFKTE